MLFDKNMTRTGGAAAPGESTFDYLQRSSRPESIRICQWINEWFEDLPPNQRAAFESRLKDKNSELFQSAVFELQVHTMLRRMGCSVEIEADFPGTDKRIDFLASNDGDLFYVEANQFGFGKGALAVHSNEYDVVMKIRKRFPNPHSHILLNAQGELNETLGADFVTKPFRKLLDRYTADEVKKIDSNPRFRDILREQICVGGWELTGSLMPKHSPSQKGHVTGPARAAIVDGSTPLRRALSKKARKWQDEDFNRVPFFVAANACHSEFSWDEGDIRRALFDDPDSGDQFDESLSSLSGVVVFENVVLGNELSARVKLYRNGIATVPKCLRSLLEERKLRDLLGIGG